MRLLPRVQPHLLPVPQSPHASVHARRVAIGRLGFLSESSESVNGGYVSLSAVSLSDM